MKMEMEMIQTDEKPTTAEDYVRLRRGIIDHLSEDKLSWEELGVLFYLIIRANPKTGNFFTSYRALTDETGKYTKNRMNKILLFLKKMKYIDYAEHRGSGKSFYLFINKYPLSNGKYLYFAEKEDAEAELSVNRQNLEESKNALVKHFSIDNDFYSGRTPNNNNKKDNID